MLLLKLDGRERQQFEESRWLWASSPWRPGLCWSNRFSCLVMPQPSDITRDESIPHRWNCPNNWSLLPFFPRFLIVLILYSCYITTSLVDYSNTNLFSYSSTGQESKLVSSGYCGIADRVTLSFSGLWSWSSARGSLLRRLCWQHRILESPSVWHEVKDSAGLQSFSHLAGWLAWLALCCSVWLYKMVPARL